MKALEQITQLLGLLSIIQGLEFLQLSRTWSDRGVWRWSHLAKDLSIFKLCLKEKPFYALNVLRLIVAATAIASPNTLSLSVLFFFHALTLIRWSGSFNGGSDFMTSILFLFTLMGLLFPETMGALGLWYIAIQLCLSYFKSGWVKLKTDKWRRGEAISQFMLSPIYTHDPILARVFESRSLSLMISWVTILFELLFPLALLDQQVALVFMGLGVLFHLGNAYVFGLNRFLFAWLTAYPALFWCSTH